MESRSFAPKTWRLNELELAWLIDMSAGNLRDLEQIQEADGRSFASRWGAALLAGLGLGALGAAAWLSSGNEQAVTESAIDPLAALIAEDEASQVKADHVDRKQVTFPKTLSDTDSPTTALAAVKDERGRLVEADKTDDSAAGDELSSEGIPRAPRPAGDVLNATTVSGDPQDNLAKLAKEAAQPPSDSTEAPAGMEGGFQIQVASFQKQGEADDFVLELRKRGHRAYRQPAYVPARGLWHRVRVGPFASKQKAAEYQKKFEKDERMTTFLVDPAKEARKRAQQKTAD